MSLSEPTPQVSKDNLPHTERDFRTGTQPYGYPSRVCRSRHILALRWAVKLFVYL